MFCIHCGKEIADNSKFCPECGACIIAPVSEPTPESAVQTADTNQMEISNASEHSNDSTDSSQAKETLPTWKTSYEKNKMIGLFTYKRIQTDVSLTTAKISIVKRAGRKKEEKKAPLSEIQGIVYKKTHDFWDTLYAVIIAILAILCLFSSNWGGAGGLGLLAAVCFISGIGKEIMIEFQDGSSFHIPVNQQSEVDDFSAHVSKYAFREISASLSTSAAKGSSSKKKKFVLIGGIVVAVLIALGVIRMLTGNPADKLGIDGEYAVVLDAFSPDEYVYLNFNYDGPGTIEMYLSDDPFNRFFEEYELLSAEDSSDGFERYTLQISGIPILTIYSVIDDGFAVDLSEEFFGDTFSGVMVPFTEKYGFRF